MKIWDWVIFLGLMLTVIVAYDFDDIYSKRPQGFHIWRQSDCASLALNYYQDDDATFFSPRTHHLMGDEGKSMGELPVIYYTVSKLYSLFGVQEGLFRCVNFLIYVIGLLHLFKLGLEYIGDRVYSSVIVLSATCSVIVIFYAFSFLPNSPSLGLVFCSWYHIYKYFQNGKRRRLYYFLGFVTLAALLKVTALLSAGIVLVLFIAERFLGQHYAKSKLFKIKSLEGLYLLIPFVAAIAWIFIAQYYQNLHDNHYFSLDWDPIWLLDSEMQTYTWRRLTSDWGWRRDIIYPGVFAVGFVSLALAWAERDKFWAHVLTLYLLASAVYVVAFFLALKDHDYYMINLIGYFPLSFVYLMKWSQKKYGKSYALYAIYAALMVFAISSTDRRHKARYDDFSYDNHLETFFDITSYAREIGIKAEDKVIVEGDETHCASLYLLNNKGWTGKLSNENRLDDKFEIFKQAGAKYLFVIGEERVHFKAVESISKKLIGQKQNVFIFELL